MNYRPYTRRERIELVLAWLLAIAGVGLLLAEVFNRGHLLFGLLLLLCGLACELRGSPARWVLGSRW